MTVYVRGAPDPSGEWYLWADTVEEAAAMVEVTGGARRPYRAPGHYGLTVEQWASAVGRGAEIMPLVHAWTNAANRLERKDLLTRDILDGLAGIA